MTFSVATQTPWSWLQDLVEIERLQQSVGTSGDNQTILIAKPESPTTMAQDEHKKQDAGESLALVLEAHTTDVVEHVGDPPSQSTDEVSQAASSGERTEEHSNSKETKLPPLVNQSEEVDGVRDFSQSPGETTKLPPLLDQLEKLQFPDVPESDVPSNSSDDESDKETNNEDEQGEEDDDEEKEDPLNIPKLRLDNLPWPSILQYMRESESLASAYFSLENKEVVESRTEAAAKMSATHDQSSNEERPDKEESDKEEVDAAGSIGACDFCGGPLPQYSLLNSVNKDEDQDMPEASSFCCEGYKEFCVLVAACMRQMVHNLRHQTPKKITVKHSNKKALKQTAEEKVLAIMRRRQRFEELKRKKAMERQLRHVKVKKHTTTIQFSLVSPDVMETGWLVRPESSNKYHHVSRRRKEIRKRLRDRKKKTTLEMSALSPQTLERLKQELRPMGDLDVRAYNDGKNLAIGLPDGTGQYYYHSGQRAILVFAPYPGVLAYLVYEDCPGDEVKLLAYLDELGRACCYNMDGSIRLLVTTTAGMIFDQQGNLRRKLTWNDPSSPSHFQPLTLPLNKHLTVKWTSQDSFTLSFTATHQQHFKFTISSKLKNEERLCENPSNVQIEAVETHLKRTKSRISQILQVLQQSNKVLKLAELQSVYAPSRSQAPRRTVNFVQVDQDVARAHKRTKSTGALSLQKSPTKLKPLMH